MTNLYDLSKLIYDDYLQMLKINDDALIWLDLESFKYKTNTSIILKVLNHYINNELVKPDFALIFEKIKELPNPCEYLYFNNITPAFLKEHLEEYLIYFKPEYKLCLNSKILNNYKEIIRKYIIYYKKQLNITQENEYKNLINEFIKSKYSLERFCIIKGLTLNDFNSKKNGIFIKIMKKDKDLYTKFLYNIDAKEKLKNLNIQTDILNILKAIKELGNDFTIINLFLMTPYAPLELTKVADNILNKEDLILFRKYMNICYRDFAIHGNFMNKERINLLIKIPYTITIDGNTIETKEEERRDAIEFLQVNEIPINSYIFDIALKRYYKNKSKERRLK